MAPYMWRANGDLAPTGIIGDTGSHVFSFMEFLVGKVSTLIADNYIATPTRPVATAHELGQDAALTGQEDQADVSNPDGSNVLCRFANGARGLVDFSRIATGRKFMQTYEIYGTKGSLAYTYDEINRLRFYSNDDDVGRRGYRAIDVGPEHDAYRAFLPLPNFALGYNETKIIEAAEMVQAITSGKPKWPTFETGHHICQIVDACMESARLKRWVEIDATDQINKET